MAESILTSQTPSVPDQSGTAITIGTVFTPSVDGTVTNLRQFFPLNNGAGAVGVLYSWTSNALGSELARKAYVGIIDGAWNVTPALSSPISLTAGSYYVAATYFPGGHYVFTGAGLASAITNGHLTAPADTGGRTNGKFNASGDGYPDQTFNSNLYFADVVFLPAASITGVLAGTATAATATGIVIATATAVLAGVAAAAVLDMSTNQPIVGRLGTSLRTAGMASIVGTAKLSTTLEP